MSGSSSKNGNVSGVTTAQLNGLKKYNKMMQQVQSASAQIGTFNGLAQMSAHMYKIGTANTKAVQHLIHFKEVAREVAASVSSAFSTVREKLSSVGQSASIGMKMGAQAVAKPFVAAYSKVKAMKQARDERIAEAERKAKQNNYLYGTPLPKPKGIIRQMRQKVGVKNTPIQDNEKLMENLSAVAGTAGSMLMGLKDKSLEAAKVFGEAMGTLRATSGAAPGHMQDLEKSLRKVGGQVPQSLNDVAAVIGTLNGKAKLSGSSLEEMSKTVLDAARLTGTGAAEAAGSAASVMDAWGKRGDEGVKMLNQFYDASRVSGVGMGDLMKSMGDFGSPLQSMGLGFEQSASLLAKWNSQGLNPIQDAMKKPLPAGGFATIAKEIQGATSSTEAAGIATKYFGELVSNDLVTALTGGQVEFQGVMAAMNNAKDAIATQSRDIVTFGDRWEMLQNRITIALAPLGELLLPFGEALASVVEVLARDGDIVLAVIGSIAALLIGVFAPALWASAVAGWAVVLPFLPLIGACLLVGAAIAGLAYLFKYHMDEIMKVVNAVTDAVMSFFGLMDTDKSMTVEMQQKTSEKAASGGGAPLTAKYHGMDYVPYDGMTARLHKGERIMPASENRAYTEGQGSGGSISITGNTFNVRQESDIDAIARALAREIKAAGGLMA